MEVINKGVTGAELAAAVALAEAEAPATGFCGNNWEAPPFDRAKAVVEAGCRGY